MAANRKKKAPRRAKRGPRIGRRESAGTWTDCKYQINPHTGERGEADALEAISSLTSRFAGSARRSVRRAAKIEAARAKNAQELREFLGERNHKRFGEFSRLQRETMYGITNVRPGEIDEAILREAKRAAHEKARRMVRRAGIDTDRLQSLFDAHTKRIRRAAQIRAGGSGILQVIPSDEAPSFGTLSGSMDDWGYVKTAPFDDWFWWGKVRKWGGSVDYRHNVLVEENPFTYITGQIGHYSRYENYSASDWDALFVDYETGVGFWYHAPEPGPRDVWIQIKAEKSSVKVWLDDEFDFSCAWSSYWSEIEVSVAQLQGTQGKTEKWHAEVDGEPDDQWYSKPLAGDGAEIWIPMTINFPPGAVFIWIIAVDGRSCGLNDVSTDATMETKYKVEAVHIQE